MASTGDILVAIYRKLLEYYGPQEWWPTRHGDPWEVMLGAVLVQHSSWRGADIALANLESALGLRALTDPEVVLEAPGEVLAELVRPAGFHRTKPRKVKNLARFVMQAGGVQALVQSSESTESLRSKLLNVWGIGPETADAILLYVLGRPVFVADAYALRLCSRWGLLPPDASHRVVQKLFMENVPRNVSLYKEYHALIVAHAKHLCRTRPLCESCPLNRPVQVEAGVDWRCPRLHI